MRVRYERVSDAIDAVSLPGGNAVSVGGGAPAMAVTIDHNGAVERVSATDTV